MISVQYDHLYVQGMMDFDYVCQREQPSVACMVYPMVGGDSKQNFYWGHKEILVPVYKKMEVTPVQDLFFWLHNHTHTMRTDQRYISKFVSLC